MTDTTNSQNTELPRTATDAKWTTRFGSRHHFSDNITAMISEWINIVIKLAFLKLTTRVAAALFLSCGMF